MTALCWIRNERPWKQYVQHRVKQIRKLTSKSDWRHCPGKQNLADLPSRGLNAKELSINNIWCNGPEFVYKPEAEWSLSEQQHEEDEVALKEAVKNPVKVTHSLVSRSPSSLKDSKTDAWIDVKRFRELTKLLRVTAIVIGFLIKLKNKVRSKSKPEYGNEILTASNLAKAEELWIKAVQTSSFEQEIKFLNMPCEPDERQP